MVAEQDQRGDEQQHADGHPGQLLVRQPVRLERVVGVGEVEPVDHREPEPVERSDDRQQDRVGVRRDHADRDVAGDRERSEAGAVAHDVGRYLTLDADAHGGVRTDPDRQGDHEQEQLRAPATPVHETHHEPRLGHQGAPSGGHLLSQVLDLVAGVVQAGRVEPLANALGVEVGEPVEGDVGRLVGLGQVDAGQRGVEAAVDHDRAVLLADEVLALAPRPGGRADHPEDTDDHGEGQQPAQPGVAAGRDRRVAGGLGVDRVAQDGGAGLRRDLGPDRLQLTGVAAAMTPEQVAGLGSAGPARAHVSGRADEQRRGRHVGGAAHDHLGHQAGDVVGAARLEAGADQLDGCVVGRAAGEDVRQPAGLEDAAAAVAAQQQPVAGLEIEDEQVRLELVVAVDGVQDQVLVRVDAGVGLGDPALVDEGLHEGVVVGELAELAVAEEVRAGVAHVAHADSVVAVEEREGGRRAGPAEGRVLVDQLGDPVVGPLQRAADQAEEVGLADLGRRRRLVELAQLRDRRAGRDVTAGRAAHAVAHDDQVRADVPGVLVVLPDATHVGDR